MSFKVGQKVVCVKTIDGLIKNEMYTIKGLFPYSSVQVEEYDESTEEHYVYYYAWRFREVDYKFAENLIESLTEKIKV